MVPRRRSRAGDRHLRSAESSRAWAPMSTEPAPTTGGDDRARALYFEHGPAIENWAHRRFGDREAAEEVVQEVVLAAWRKHAQFDPSRGSERAWMFGIARHVAATRYRRNRRHLASVPTAEPPDDRPRRHRPRTPRRPVAHRRQRSLPVERTPGGPDRRILRPLVDTRDLRATRHSGGNREIPPLLRVAHTAGGPR